MNNENNIKYYLCSAMRIVILLFTTGGIIQTFFAGIGFSVNQISTYTALTSGVQVCIMIVNIFIADRIKNVRKLSALLRLGPAVLCVVMLVFCAYRGINVNIAFKITIVLCIVLNIFEGVSNVLIYKLPYLVVDIKNIAWIENNVSIIGGICSIAISFLISMLSVRYSYNSVMSVAFSISILLCVFSTIIILSMKENKNVEVKTSESFSFEKLKKKEFVYFYTPNLLRGMATGVINIISVICIKNITSNQAIVSGLVTLLSVSAIAGCFLYQLIKKKLTTVQVYVIFSVVMAVFLPLMLIGKSIYVFYITYFVVGMCFNIINVSGSVFATELMDFNDMGTYTSSRLILMTLGQTVAGVIISAVIDKVPSAVILIAGGFAQLISGLMYHLWKTRFSKSSNRGVVKI